MAFTTMCPVHLNRYLAEFDLPYNSGDDSTPNVATWRLKGSEESPEYRDSCGPDPIAENGRGMKRESVFLIIDAFTPDTLPMSRLAEYLKSFAAMLGSEANVHFDSVLEGSAPVKLLSSRKMRQRFDKGYRESLPKLLRSPQ